MYGCSINFEQVTNVGGCMSDAIHAWPTLFNSLVSLVQEDLLEKVMNVYSLAKNTHLKALTTKNLS
jgi:hypothetical protein